MSVWMDIYEETDLLLRQFRAGKIKPEEFQAIGSAISLKLKAARGEASCEIASMKSTKLRNSLKSKRLIANDGTAMGATLALPESEEKIKCPGQGEKIITRSQCLDHSGKAENLDDCRGCDFYVINRDLVLGPKPYVA